MTFEDLLARSRPPARPPGEGSVVPAPPDVAPADPGGTAAASAGLLGGRPEVFSALGLLVAMGLWWLSLGQFRLQDAGNLGILQAMPVSFVAALVLLGIVFAATLAQDRPSNLLLALIVAGLVVVMFSVPNLVDGTGMMPVGYVHAGFVDYISQHHAVLRGYDARFDWPGFFAAASVLVSVAGLHSALPLLEWAPLGFELLALAPMLLLARSILGRGRAAWLAVVLYYSGCWFSQDYFAPQAMDHLLYLSAMAVLFWTVSGTAPARLPGQRGRPRFGWRGPQPPPGLSDGTAFVIQLALTVVIAAMVVTHQLTPVGFVIQLAVLSLLGATRYRALWLVAGLLTVAWFSYAATDFWQGHLAGLVGNVGQVNSAVSKGLTTRVSAGDPTYLHMQLVRTAWSGMFLLTGAIGGLMLLRRRAPLAIAAGACAVVPFSLIVLQSYGGEIFLRCFLYAMPFLGILTAAAISPVFRLSGIARVTFVALVVIATTFGLVITRSVNIAFERVSSDSLAAAKYIAAVTPVPTVKNKKTVGLAEFFAPVGFEDIDTLKATNLGRDCELRLAECAIETAPQYILLTLEQEDFGRLRMQLPPGWLLDAGSAQLSGSAGYRVVFDRPGAVVLKSTPATAAAVKAAGAVQAKAAAKARAAKRRAAKIAAKQKVSTIAPAPAPAPAPTPGQAAVSSGVPS